MSFSLQDILFGFKELISNSIFLSCLCSWFFCQVIKTIIKLFTDKISSANELFELLFWKTGSMPSSHSALVASLCTSVCITQGIHSEIFILSLAFYLITIRDAVGVRRANGEHAKRINEIGNLLKEKGIDPDFLKVKEVHGHTPLEVLFGSLVGVLMGVLFSVIK